MHKPSETRFLGPIPPPVLWLFATRGNRYVILRCPCVPCYPVSRRDIGRRGVGGTDVQGWLPSAVPTTPAVANAGNGQGALTVVKRKGHKSQAVVRHNKHIVSSHTYRVPWIWNLPRER